MTLVSLAEIKVEEGHKNNTTYTSNSTTKTRRISFCFCVFVRESIHIKDFSEKERVSCGYNSGEYKMMKAQIKFTLQRLEKGGNEIDSEVHCSRGLEYQTKMGAMQR